MALPRHALILSCAAFIVGVAQADLRSVVCQDGATFQGDLPFQGSTCDDAMSMYLGHLMNSTHLSPEECDSEVDHSFPVRAAILYMMKDCCPGKPVGRFQICGENYPDGNFCEDPGAFRPEAETGDHHCKGDELIEDEAFCKSVGESAWDPNAEEKCDVGRLWVGEEDDFRRACESLYGSWESFKCLDMYTGYFLMEAEGDVQGLACRNPELGQEMVRVGHGCCSHWQAGMPDTQAPVRIFCPPGMESPGREKCATVTQDRLRHIESMGYEPRRCSQNTDTDARSGFYRYKVCSADQTWYYEGLSCKHCGNGFNCTTHIEDRDGCEMWDGPKPTGCVGPEAMNWYHGGHKSVMVECSDINHPRLIAWSGEGCTGTRMTEDYKEFCWDEGNGEDIHSSLGYYDCPAH